MEDGAWLQGGEELRREQGPKEGRTRSGLDSLPSLSQTTESVYETSLTRFSDVLESLLEVLEWILNRFVWSLRSWESDGSDHRAHEDQVAFRFLPRLLLFLPPPTTSEEKETSYLSPIPLNPPLSPFSSLLRFPSLPSRNSSSKRERCRILDPNQTSTPGQYPLQPSTTRTTTPLGPLPDQVAVKTTTTTRTRKPQDRRRWTGRR